MKAIYTNEPLKLEAVGNGSFLYRWNIQQEEIPTNENEEAHIQWNCDEVVVWAPLSANKIVKAVMEQQWDYTIELKFINEYNSAKLNLYGEYTSEEAQEKILAYENFLETRKNLKTQIDADWEELNN